MASIYETIIDSHVVINHKKGKFNLQANKKAKKNFGYCVNLLMKGYSLDDDIAKLMIQYQHIDKIPDAKTHLGPELTDVHMANLMELVFPKVPNNHMVMVMVQKFGQKTANYISNGDRLLMIDALRTLAQNLEDGKDIPMPSSN